MRKGRNQAGFTLMELIVVMAVIGLLTAIAIPRFTRAPRKAREAVLKTNLHTMRECFDQYFADKSYYPDSLQTLVDEGYLREVPKDPFTDSSGDWDLIYAQESQDDLSPDAMSTGPGIFDVKSTASYVALDGTNVSEW